MCVVQVSHEVSMLLRVTLGNQQAGNALLSGSCLGFSHVTVVGILGVRKQSIHLSVIRTRFVAKAFQNFNEAQAICVSMRL